MRNPRTEESGNGALSVDRPQRIQSSRERSTPRAAADSGCKVSETSTQAQTLPAWVWLATKVSASEVRPEHSGPTISLRAPAGNPPCSSSSISPIPVGATVQAIFGEGVSAEGILFARFASIWARKCWAVDMANLRLIFAYADEMCQPPSVGKSLGL